MAMCPPLEKSSLSLFTHLMLVCKCRKLTTIMAYNYSKHLTIVSFPSLCYPPNMW